MSKKCRFIFPLLLGLAPALWANPANGDPRLEKLFSSYMAPCCWQENLTLHHSPKADELRAEITRMVAAGKSDDEIKKVLVSEYTIRILAMPEGAYGEWLRWTPLAAILIGLAAIALVIRRSLRPAAPNAPAGALPDFDESELDEPVR